jgi:hypothetical protein
MPYYGVFSCAQDPKLDNKRGSMEAKLITYGETALDKLAQWLRSTGQPQDITSVTEQYLDLLRQLVVEDENND